MIDFDQLRRGSLGRRSVLRRALAGGLSVLATPLKPRRVRAARSAACTRCRTFLEVVSRAGKSMLSVVHLVDDDDPAEARLAGLVEHAGVC